jgi:hypothetical protein
LCAFFLSYTQGKEHEHVKDPNHNHTPRDTSTTFTSTSLLLDSSKGSTQNVAVRPKSTGTDSLLLHDWLHKNHQRKKLAGDEKGCLVGADSQLECLRRDPDVIFMDKGVPGVENTLLSLETLRPISYQPFFNPVVQNALHSNGGLILPQTWEQAPYSDLALREAWVLPSVQDTPSTHLQWERGPFEMNIFHFKLQRLLSKQAYLALDLFNASSNSEEYEYTAVVHQPYLSGVSNLNLGSIWKSFDRDSSNIVLEGVSQRAKALNFRPRMGWIFSPQSVLETYWEYYSNSSQGITPISDSSQNSIALDDSSTIRERIQQPFSSNFTSQSLGALYRYQREYSKLFIGTKWGRYNKSSAAYTHLDHSPTFDTSQTTLQGFEGTSWEQFLEVEQDFEFWYQDVTLDFTLLGGFHGRVDNVEGPLFITNTIDSSYTEVLRRGIDTTLGQRDEQIVYGGMKWQSKYFRGKFIGQGHRISFMDNTREWIVGYNTSLRWDMWKNTPTTGLHILGSASKTPSVPDWQQLYVDNSLIFQTPSPGQHAGSLEHVQVQLGGKLSWVKGYVSWNRFFGNNTLEQKLLPDKSLDINNVNTSVADTLGTQQANSLSIEQALGYRQYHATAWETWVLGLHLSLGNWDVAVSYSHLLKKLFQAESGGQVVENKGIPNSVHKGHIQWEKALINNRMLLTLKVDWSRFGKRLAWQPQWDGSAEVVELDEFWAVDFQAQAKIQSFVLYYKIKNLNHDRYYIAPGDHPPGIQFRWGVNWSFGG